MAEGFQRETAKEEERFLYYAKSALGERLTQTYIGIDVGCIDLRPSPHGKHNDQIRTNPTRTS
ncbi:four helix bundle protein [Vibrio diabolicus]|uniref:four helix bundle protein n=1 Tax=Vibrio diabolicus TaxID=50719 RepID=UPI0035A5DAA8